MGEKPKVPKPQEGGLKIRGNTPEDSFLAPVDDLPEKVKRRGRTSFIVFEQFIAMNVKHAKMDIEKIAPGRKVQSLLASLKIYAQNHPDLNVAINMVQGEIYLTRTDL